MMKKTQSVFLAEQESNQLFSAIDRYALRCFNASAVPN